jgi:excisionase family DNA binding protein
MAETNDIKILVTRQEAARRISCSVRTIDTFLARKELPSVRVGRRRLIPRAALERFAQQDHSTK